MADYNIYIHDATTSQDIQIPTKAWRGNASQTNASQGSEVAKQVSEFANKASNPDSLVSAGVGALAKASPYVAAAVVVVSAATKIADMAIDANSMVTGDYRVNVKWQNMKNATSILLRPFSTVLESIKMQTEIMLENQRNQQKALLVGEEITNVPLSIRSF